MSFAWSFKPIFIWLTVLLGINLDFSKKRSTIGRYTLIIYSSVFFLTVTYFQLGPIWDLYFHSPNHLRDKAAFANKTENSYLALNFQINQLTQVVLCILIHFCFVVNAKFKWETLWNRLEQIQQVVGHQLWFYRRLRKISMIAVSLLLLVSRALEFTS